MKTLYLLRHAKSSWKDDTLIDIERPLKGRGRKAAKDVGKFLKKQAITPDLILSSSAVRARETADIVIKAADLNAELRFDERLYEASPERILEVISQIEKSKKTVLVVAHNPGLEDFVELLTGTLQLMPTATLSKVVSKASNWTAIAEKGSNLEWSVKPKHLKKFKVES